MTKRMREVAELGLFALSTVSLLASAMGVGLGAYVAVLGVVLLDVRVISIGATCALIAVLMLAGSAWLFLRVWEGAGE